MRRCGAGLRIGGRGWERGVRMSGMDDAARKERACEIFCDALQRPAEVRSKFVQSACGEDGDLRRGVESLLEAHGQMGDFLEQGTQAPEGRSGRFLAELPGGVARRAQAGSREGPGSVIGRYKLLQMIGEGGFGTVFMAEQEQPIRRRVALKVLKAGMDTRQVIARFEAERQALAMMDHASIAKVLDAGETESGRPYFVMELVRGVPITEYCDRHNLTTRQRLELFVQVCLAVQHAHQKAIIHRDIKPSNVLVTVQEDGNPLPKVIDFGIAKATQGRLTDKTLFTEFRQLIGTPQYMSPEQAEMTGIDIDTRSDIYSLGVLLYELITGTTPLDAEELRSKGPGDMQRMIREVEPPRPSTRLATLKEGTLSEVAARRRTEARRLGRLVRGELDWIVMKCLEKDRTRRYESAAAVGADVRRHLENEPVLARPASTLYQFGKFVRKHKGTVAAAVTVAAALMLGIVGTTLGLWRATQAKGVAQKAEGDAKVQKAAAERSAERALSVNDFMQGILSKARLDVAGGGRDVKVVDLLDRAAAEIPQTLAGQPEAEMNARTTLGESYLSLGMPEVADEHFSRAHQLAAARFGEDSEQALLLATRVIAFLLDFVRTPA
jgi:serine/threonine protein kinase